MHFFHFFKHLTAQKFISPYFMWVNVRCYFEVKIKYMAIYCNV